MAMNPWGLVGLIGAQTIHLLRHCSALDVFLGDPSNPKRLEFINFRACSQHCLRLGFFIAMIVI